MTWWVFVPSGKTFHVDQIKREVKAVCRLFLIQYKAKPYTHWATHCSWRISQFASKFYKITSIVHNKLSHLCIQPLSDRYAIPHAASKHICAAFNRDCFLPSFRKNDNNAPPWVEKNGHLYEIRNNIYSSLWFWCI